MAVDFDFSDVDAAFDEFYEEAKEANAELDDKPELVNEDVYGNGWLIKISVSDPSELDELMSAAEYEQMIAK